MSGGSLNYFYCDMENHIGDFKDKELDDLVRDLAQLFHDREWYLSSDTGRGSWNESRDAFKEKWFTKHGREKRITEYMDAIRDEVLESFGVSDRYCVNCVHWTLDNRYADEKYGNCDITKGCLMHRKENCEKFQRQTEMDTE